jgi:hypothetical protein
MGHTVIGTAANRRCVKEIACDDFLKVGAGYDDQAADRAEETGAGDCFMRRCQIDAY